MRTRPDSWWQKIKRTLEIIGIITALITGIVLIYVVVRSYGTGFDGYNQISISTDIAPPPHKITRIEVYQPGKALWDWLQLLIIPLVLAVGGYVFNLTVSRNEQKSTQLRDQTEQEIASDNQREAALQAYIDKISELLLNNKLRESAEDAEVRKIARVRTLTVLPRLDKVRKKSVLQFLYEAGFLDKDKPIVDLQGANLRGADLSFANLSYADLSRADLSGAFLVGANLGRADLREANLSDADLREAYLGEAYLSEADLSRAYLSKATLSEATLSEADLRGADLRGADLSEADLSEADLSEADLSEADLSSAKHVTTEQLEKAKSLEGATMPDGSIHP